MSKRDQKPKVKYATDDTPIPSVLDETIVEDGITFLAPRGNQNADIMFVSSCALEEEIDDSTGPAFLLKGPSGAMFSRALKRCHLSLEDCWYTTLIKHCLPRKQKLKPTSLQIERNQHLIEEEIKRVKPKLVVCLGKVPFDYFCPFKLKLKEALGGLFKSEKYNCMVYCMDDLVKVLWKPELLDRMYTDIREFKRTIEEMHEGEEIPLNYRMINREADLIAWVEEVKNERLFSNDCEWGGQNYVDGQLRYAQFCWKPGHAVCLQFRDVNQDWMFDCSLERVAEILDPVMNHPDTRFIGHNIAADFVWMKHWLKVDMAGRIAFDTMFAMQCINEYADLKLERLSVKFTPLGRYDIPLIIWKKENKVSLDEGYERIPDEILFPYSCKDVDVPMRCYPIMTKLLVRENVWDYYINSLLPFVSTGFAEMCETGIPVNREDMDQQRELFLFVKEELEKVFLHTMEEEALQMLLSLFKEHTGDDMVLSMQMYAEVLKLWETDDHLGIRNYVKTQFKHGYKHFHKVLEHLFTIKSFNHKSSDQMRTWLYDVKGYIPIASTKSEGMPSVSWERVLKLKPEQQKEYKPSTDKDTLKIFADRGDPVVAELLELKAVSTVTRTFLRPNDEQNNEEGLHKYVAKDGRVHANFALTETGRPRAFHPNILNIPKYIAKDIERAFDKVTKYHLDRYGEVPDILEDPKPLRWNFKAPPGYCFVESDYKTAEVFAIAYIAGDFDMIKTLTEPDDQYGLLMKDDGTGRKEPKPVRVAYNRNTAITEDRQDASRLHDINDPDLLRNEDGSLVHPRRDVHWELAECDKFCNEPREKLDKDKHRAGGKVGNFQIPYQSSPALIERKIEVDTGHKPEEGTGQKIIDAYLGKNANCALWLDNQKSLPEDPGYIVSISGAKRRFFVHPADLAGLSEYARESIIEPLRRQACNWPIQHIVAASLAKAVVKANSLYKERNMHARVSIPLYDALYTLCRIDEIDQVKEIHQIAMADINVWDFGDRQLKFELDTEVTLRWACAMDESDKKEFEEQSKILESNKI
jgi:uracil-DNA glycosylase family 4